MALPAPRGLVRVVPATLGRRRPADRCGGVAFEPLLADPAGMVRRRAAEPVQLASA